MNKIVYHNEPFTFQQTIYFLGENDYKETSKHNYPTSLTES